MLLQDSQGQTYRPIRKFGESRLPIAEMDQATPESSLAQLFLPDGRLVVPAGNGRFQIAESGEVLVVVPPI